MEHLSLHIGETCLFNCPGCYWQKNMKGRGDPGVLAPQDLIEIATILDTENLYAAINTGDIISPRVYKDFPGNLTLTIGPTTLIQCRNEIREFLQPENRAIQVSFDSIKAQQISKLGMDNNFTLQRAAEAYKMLRRCSRSINALWFPGLADEIITLLHKYELQDELIYLLYPHGVYNFGLGDGEPLSSDSAVEYLHMTGRLTNAHLDYSLDLKLALPDLNTFGQVRRDVYDAEPTKMVSNVAKAVEALDALSVS